MEEIKIFEKLKNIQSELKAPKGQYNDYGKYKYRSCEDIFEALKPLLDKYDLILQTNDELVNIGERYYIKATATLTDMNGHIISNTGYAREEETKKGMDGSQITGASSSYARKYALNGLFLIDDTKDSDTTNTGEEITKEEAKAFKFLTGKHKGKTILQLQQEDEDYLIWWLDQGKDEKIKQMISLITGLAPTPIPSEEEQQERFNLLTRFQQLLDTTNSDYDKLLKHYGVHSNADLTNEQLKDAINVMEKKNG